MFNHSTDTSKATATAGSASSKAGQEDRYCITAYEDGQFFGVMSGMGRNKGTWDGTHSRRSAQRHARALRAERPHQRFHVESST